MVCVWGKKPLFGIQVRVGMGGQAVELVQQRTGALQHGGDFVCLLVASHQHGQGAAGLLRRSVVVWRFASN